ncbi:unannotated protein [freshwater metagenome]|uniref:Unannotated protein n=1 Tax=freshwater metagenome TaxID=449393 RepID=A0A6J7SWA4_9ZZZZ
MTSELALYGPKFDVGLIWAISEAMAVTAHGSPKPEQSSPGRENSTDPFALGLTAPTSPVFKRIDPPQNNVACLMTAPAGITIDPLDALK